MFTETTHDIRVGALGAVLVTSPLKNTLGGMPLLAVPAEACQQQLVEEPGKVTQLRPIDLSRSLVAGRKRKAHHLPQARAQNPEMACCRPFAHAP